MYSSSRAQIPAASRRATATWFGQCKPWIAALLALALSATAVFVHNVADAAPPAGWTNTTLPSDGHDLVLDEARGVIYISMPAANAIAVINMGTGQLLRQIAVPGQPQGIALAAAGNVLYAALDGAGSIAIVDLATDAVTTVDIQDELGSAFAFDVFEVDSDRVLVSAIGGLARIVLVSLSTGAKSRVASNTAIYAAPVFIRAGADFVLIGEGFSPNSLYKLDLNDPTFPLVLEDVHGTVDGTQYGQASPNGATVYLPGDTLNAVDFTSTGLRAINGRPMPTPDGTRVTFLTNNRGLIVVDASTFFELHRIETDCDRAAPTSIGAATAIDASSTTQYTLSQGTMVCADVLADPCESAVEFDIFDESDLRTALTCFNRAVVPADFALRLQANITLTAPTAVINNPLEGLTLAIAGDQGYWVDGAGTGTVFTVVAGDVQFEFLGITGGRGPNGGGIHSTGDVTVFRATVAGNIAVSPDSGSAFGGGAFVASGRFIVVDSTFYENGATNGGGIAIAGGDVSIVDSTLSTNFAQSSGGGIHLEGGELLLFFSTVTANQAISPGPGLSVNAGAATVVGSIISDNTNGLVPEDVDVGGGAIISDGYNVIGSGPELSAFASPGDIIIGSGALLGPLEYNGGWNLTHILFPGSPAIDRATQPFEGLHTDQRGIIRPAGGARDSGAIEIESMCNGKVVTIDMNTNGGNGNGTAGADVILGTPGDDAIHGLGGDDIICGGRGRDRIFAGPGADTVFGGLDIDYIYGEAGEDTLDGEGGSDRMYGGSGNDLMLGDSGADRMFGGPGDDEMRGMGGQDFMWGEDGDDLMQGTHQSDNMWGGPGNDSMFGAGGKDSLLGEAGNDSLSGGNNTDYLNGGDDVDTANGGRGRDKPLTEPKVRTGNGRLYDGSGCIAETIINCQPNP